MEEITLPNDIRVMYVTASTFPEGIQEAMEKLHSVVSFSPDRKYLSISRPEPSAGGNIVYRSGAEVLEKGEAEKLNLQTLVLKKGNYLSQSVTGFRKDPLRIKSAFDEILRQPNLDPQGYCVEWYANHEETVQCMIRLEQ